MFEDGFFGPGRRIEVADHQQLRERIKAEFDAVGVNRPARLYGDGVADRGEIIGGSPLLVIGKIWQRYSEIRA